MINTMSLLVDAWMLLLDGHLTYNSINVPVYEEDIPESVTGHYVLLRAEGEFDTGNKRSFSNQSVVVVDIITVFENNVDRSVADNIDGQIAALILPTTITDGIPDQVGFQVLNINMETSQYVREGQPGSATAIYRKVSRYKHTIYQTA